MKQVKVLLLTTVIGTAFTAQAHEGTFVRGQIGGSFPTQTRKDDQYFTGSTTYNHSKKAGIYGGLGIEHRQNIHQHMTGGILVEINLDSSKYKQESAIPSSNASQTVNAKRSSIVNVLGQIGLNMKHNFMPYVLAGASYAQFKFSTTALTGSTVTAYGYKRSLMGTSVGAGIAHSMNAKWALDLRYLCNYYGKVKVNASYGPLTAPAAYHTATVGVSYKL
jgi:opacity protein-like surface antigen